ncbi:MAG: ATP-binding cassette domain-containing protein [bacterium]|nr:ATP-binding cassette domain-containing protein [bacterium]
MTQVPDPGQAHVDIINVRLKLEDRVIFDSLSCRFPQGGLSVVLGASGAGKSTLLRMISGLQKPDFGDIWIGDDEVTDLNERQTQRVRRKIGMMFQGGALLDSMSVFDNVALPLREHTNLPGSEIGDRVRSMFDSVGLENVERLLPGQLSGGMMKRVALARAMITEPEILLCDEPFSGLDPIAVRLIETLLVDVNQRTNVTMILTNHNIATTLRMADEVVFVVDRSAISGPVKQVDHSLDPRLYRHLQAAGYSAFEAEPSS